MAEAANRIVEETSDDGPEFETLATLVEAGALRAAEREELKRALARARVVFLTGEDTRRVGRLFGALMEEVEFDGRGPVMVPPAEDAGEQLEAMRSCGGFDGGPPWLAVYDLWPENVGEACRLSMGGPRVLTYMDEEYATGGGEGGRPAQVVVEMVARALREAGQEGGEGEVLMVYASGWTGEPGRVSTCWVHAGREPVGRWRVFAFLGVTAAFVLAAFVVVLAMGAAGWSGRAVAWAVFVMVVAGAALLYLLSWVLLPAGGEGR